MTLMKIVNLINYDYFALKIVSHTPICICATVHARDCSPIFFYQRSGGFSGSIINHNIV